MKVLNIKENNNSYTVELKPNFIERLFGTSNKIKEYRRKSFETYSNGGGGVYYDKKGKELENHHFIQKAIDDFRRAW